MSAIIAIIALISGAVIGAMGGMMPVAMAVAGVVALLAIGLGRPSGPIHTASRPPTSITTAVVSAPAQQEDKPARADPRTCDPESYLSTSAADMVLEDMYQQRRSGKGQQKQKHA